MSYHSEFKAKISQRLLVPSCLGSNYFSMCHKFVKSIARRPRPLLIYCQHIDHHSSDAMPFWTKASGTLSCPGLYWSKSKRHETWTRYCLFNPKAYFSLYFHFAKIRKKLWLHDFLSVAAKIKLLSFFQLLLCCRIQHNIQRDHFVSLLVNQPNCLEVFHLAPMKAKHYHNTRC